MKTSHYSESYHEARQKFLDATTDADRRFHDPIVDDLTIDTAVYEAPKPKNILMVVSGTHGVEGYSGSAVQLHILERFKDRLNNETSLVLIHALNPHGFHHKKRVNHHRVDLNRTFHDLPADYTTGDESIDAAFDALYPILTPRRTRGAGWIESLRFYGSILPLVIRSKRSGTYGAVKNAIAGGQYRYPDAPFYGGSGAEKEVEVFHRILTEVTEGQDHLLLLDCHTGLGKRGEAVYFAANAPDSDAFKDLANIEPSFTSIVADGTQSDEIYEAKGTLVQYALRHTRSRYASAFGLDIGTIPNIPLLSRIIAENQVHHHPDTPEPIARKVQNEFTEAFYPSSPHWRANTLKLYDDFLEKLVGKFGLG